MNVVSPLPPFILMLKLKKKDFINLITSLFHTKVTILQCVRFKYTLYRLNCKTLTQIPPLIHSTKLSSPVIVLQMLNYCKEQKHKRRRALLLCSGYSRIKMLTPISTHTSLAWTERQATVQSEFYAFLHFQQIKRQK